MTAIYGMRGAAYVAESAEKSILSNPLTRLNNLNGYGKYNMPYLYDLTTFLICSNNHVRYEELQKLHMKNCNSAQES